MYGSLKNQLKKELSSIESSGLFKKERVITSSQGASVRVEGDKEVIIMCANNYLGLSSNTEVNILSSTYKSYRRHAKTMSF